MARTAIRVSNSGLFTHIPDGAPAPKIDPEVATDRGVGFFTGNLTAAASAPLVS